MKIKTFDDREEVLDVNFSDGVFQLIDQSGDCRTVYYPKIKICNDYDPNKYTVEVLHNSRPDYGENNIFQVKIPYNGERIRIGWIFPLQTIESNEHAFAENEHFLRYAFVALYNIFKKDYIIEEGHINDAISLEDFVSMDITLLVIDNDNVASIPGFCLNNYIVSLFSYGYSFSGKGNLYDSCITNSGQYLVLKPISGQLTNNTYVESLFKYYIPTANDPVSKFHACYQIVEILISVIFDNEFKRFLNELKNLGPTGDLFKKKEKLDKLINEKSRIKKLFGSYSALSTEERALIKETCDLLLTKLNIEIPDTAGESLYAVRCTLVHRCYMIDAEVQSVLRDICDIFCGIAIKILLNFRMPNDVLEEGEEGKVAQ